MPRPRSTVVITGANSGIGLGAARHFAGTGARVVMACRSVERASVAAAQVVAAHSAAHVEVRELDLARLDSIRRFAGELASEGGSIDVLLNNAGVMAVDRSTTVDGYEMHFGVNHLGHFALTGLLLPLLGRAPGPARVVNVSSMAHRVARLDLDDPMYEHRRYSRWGAYFQSKLANLLFTAELHRRLDAVGSGVTAVAAHPGYARTEVGKTGSSLTNRVLRTFAPLMPRTADAGARSLAYAALEPGVKGGDVVGPRWWMAGRPVVETPSRRARDASVAHRLWELSEHLTGIAYPPTTA